METVLARPQYWWLRNQKFWLAMLFVLTVPTLTYFRAAAPLAAPMDPLAKSAARRLPPESPLEKVWRVDTKNGIETWSNGLHIDTRFATINRPREYYAWNRNNPNSSLVQLPSQKAAGIVFHTTESTLEDLSEHKTSRLKLLGESMVQFARTEKAYHFVIDRFGRVFRIVAEEDAANHSGKSIWADSKWAYIALNESFLAIAFETQTKSGDDAPVIAQAQIDAGRLLTRMLRARYDIPASNCVTHAQVSVNPSNFLIGYHTDWAGNFPFEEIGLPDNYAQPLGSIHLFGFTYDNTFFAATGARMWKGLGSADDLLREEARQKSLSVAQLRTQLRNNYRRLSALLPENNAPMAEQPSHKTGKAEEVNQ